MLGFSVFHHASPTDFNRSSTTVWPQSKFQSLNEPPSVSLLFFHVGGGGHPVRVGGTEGSINPSLTSGGGNVLLLIIFDFHSSLFSINLACVCARACVHACACVCVRSYVWLLTSAAVSPELSCSPSFFSSSATLLSSFSLTATPCCSKAAYWKRITCSNYLSGGMGW